MWDSSELLLCMSSNGRLQMSAFAKPEFADRPYLSQPELCLRYRPNFFNSSHRSGGYTSAAQEKPT